MLVLGLVWQLMRAYTLSLLRKLKPDGTPIAEKDILAWANKKLSDAGKEPIKSFQVSYPMDISIDGRRTLFHFFYI